jgi:hypothetical protein
VTGPASVPSRRGRKPESGYALLLVIFLVASMALFAAVATPSVLTEGRRERETEMVWRGNQYVRAIRLYYQKYGRLPASLEDLTRPDATGVHFLRKDYTDPMNKADGSWRLIYASPTGQLTGSVRYHSLQEMAAKLGLTTTNKQTSGASAGGTQQSTQQQNSSSPSPSPAAPSQQPGLGLQPVEGSVLGASVVGVGSKVKRPSLRVYQGGKTYEQWEFIWNPLANGIAISSPGAATPAAAPGATSGSGNGSPTTVPANPSGGTEGQPPAPTGPASTPTQPGP